jgi:hypothetical protein
LLQTPWKKFGETKVWRDEDSDSMNPQAMATAANSAANLMRVVIFGGAAVYGLSNSIFNVEGGHRAVVFNRVFGIKDTVRQASMECHAGII